MTCILFIDDDVLALQLMSKVTSLLGLNAIVSDSPRKGLTLAAKEKPALILVDMQMTEMDGTEFVRQIRRLPEIAHLPVLIFSAGIGYSDEDKARNAGANGFLQKPVTLQKLSQVIQAFT